MAIAMTVGASKIRALQEKCMTSLGDGNESATAPVVEQNVETVKKDEEAPQAGCSP
jgi:hypothetical protein